VLIYFLPLRFILEKDYLKEPMMDGKVKILLVDRDAEFLEKTSEFLKTKEFEVITARTALDAAGMVTYDHPDLIVSEIELENRDSGFKFCRSVKADANTRHIPFMILTGIKERTGETFTMEEDGYWMKTDDYADKPLSEEELIERISRLLAGKKEHRDD